MSSEPLVTQDRAIAAIRHKIDQKWAEAICADYGIDGPLHFSVPARSTDQHAQLTTIRNR